MNQSCDSRSLVPGDDRLLVFRALDHGLSSGVIQAGFICREKAVLEGMSFVFARRYYTLVHEACLRQASQCVLGIVNLGLSERSGGRLSVAADFLTSRGSLGMFREGWTRFSNWSGPQAMPHHTGLKQTMSLSGSLLKISLRFPGGHGAAEIIMRPPC